MITTRKPNAARANRHALFRRLVAAIVARYGATTESSDGYITHRLSTPCGPLALSMHPNENSEVLALHGWFSDRERRASVTSNGHWNDYERVRSQDDVREFIHRIDVLLSAVMDGTH